VGRRAGIQASGIYFYGSGERFATTTGQDRRQEGAAAASEQRLLADGSILPRAELSAAQSTASTRGCRSACKWAT
jgi:hypothetical protein